MTKLSGAVRPVQIGGHRATERARPGHRESGGDLRCDLLADALGGLARVEVPNQLVWELLVVDNNSTDDTAAVVDRFRDRLPIRGVFEPEPGLSHARNRGLAHARGAHLAFIDNDVLVEPDWLVELAAAISSDPRAWASRSPSA